MKILYLTSVLIFLGMGCHHEQQPTVKDGPEYSSVVIRHFSRDIADSLKRKAACFLLSQMKDHYGDSVGKPDSETITENQLIEHIEYKFRQLDSCPWLTGISFENFSEYLLPYRVASEPVNLLTEPLNPYRKKFNYIITHYDDCLNSSYQLGQLLLKSSFANEKMSLVKAIPEVRHLRALGIPATIDFFPVSERDNPQKAWIYIPDDRLQPQSPKQMPGYRNGKVYRKTFSHNPIPQANPGEYIPPFFRTPFQKDVTGDYQYTRSVTLSFPTVTEAQHAYLALFNDSIWQPVAWSKVTQRQCRFEQLGTGEVYLPVYYQDSLMVAWKAPFLLTANGELRYLAADSTLTNVTINRTRPYHYHSDWLNNYFPGSLFASADDKQFKTNLNTYRINHPHYRWGHIKLTPPRTQRYWRHSGRINFPFHLAELQFVDTAGQILTGNFFGPDTEHTEAMTDNNPESYKSYKGWIGIDFDKPVTVSEIRYLLPLPHRILPHHRYELLYFREGRWQSAGIQTARGEEITFTSIPAGYLYRLADLDTDEHSNIFTIENQEIRFR